MVPNWFLYLGGFSLVILGVLQIQQRPRKEGDSLYTRFVNVGTLWSLTCIGVGALLVLIALGWVDLHLMDAPVKPPHHKK